jgi:hypothetical protein
MNDVTRRRAMQQTVGASLLAAFGLSEPGAGAGDDREKAARTNRHHVLAAGVMELKAECWALAAQTAGSFVGPA